jgi:hypothetical protein
MKHILSKITAAILFAASMQSTSAFGADGVAAWRGLVNTDWATAANWLDGQLPSAPATGTGATFIDPNPNNLFPVVSTLGNTTPGYFYIGTNTGFTVVSGGELTVAGNLTTGQWGNTLPINITGGLLNMGGYLNMGAGGFDGSVNISGGTVTAGDLGINTTSGSKLNISGNGTFITPYNPGLFGAIQYWVNSGNITANGNAAGWSVNLDTVSQAGKVVVTAVPEPSTLASMGMGLALLAATRSLRKKS